MNDHLFILGRDEDDQLEEVGGAVGTDDKPSVRVLAQVINERRVLDGVEHVVVSDAVAAGGRMDLHTNFTVLRIQPPNDEGDHDVGGVRSKLCRR